MRKSLIVLALMVLLIGVIVNITDGVKVLNKVGSSSKVLSDETFQHQELQDTEDAISEPSASPTVSGQLDNTDNITIGNVDVLTYPGSTVSQATSVSLKMASDDSINSIIDWYKGMLTKLGFTITNAETTINRGKDQVQITGTKSNSTVTVEIQKIQATSSATIDVDIVQ